MTLRRLICRILGHRDRILWRIGAYDSSVVAAEYKCGTCGRVTHVGEAEAAA